MEPLAQPRIAERERVWSVPPGDGDACGVEPRAHRQSGPAWERPGARPAIPGLPEPTPLALQRLAQRGDEVDDLLALLMDHAEPDPPGGPAGLRRAVAEAIAQASLGDSHLWQDLQLPSRAELSALFERHFPRLAARNTQNMKWKKFLYKQLCEREEIFVCKSPSCAVCSDYAHCFGPEIP